MSHRTLSSYQRLGLGTRDLSDYLPLRHTRSQMEKQQSEGMDESFKTLVEEALNKQREEMMKQFSKILGKQEAHASQRNPKFGGQTPFKV